MARKFFRSVASPTDVSFAAVTFAREEGEHKVLLDQVIKTMYETGKDMLARYKETSLGGLATLNIIEC